jgi:hypothetical protein
MYKAYFLGGGPLEGKNMMVRPEEQTIHVAKAGFANWRTITDEPDPPLPVSVKGTYKLLACDFKRMRAVYEWVGWEA